MIFIVFVSQFVVLFIPYQMRVDNRHLGAKERV